jgi:hypothetical protein
MDSLKIYAETVKVIEDAIGCECIAYDEETPIVRPSFKLNMSVTTEPLTDIVSYKDVEMELVYFAKNKKHSQIENQKIQSIISKLLMKDIITDDGDGFRAESVRSDRTVTGELRMEWNYHSDFDEDWSSENDTEMLENLDIEIYEN